MNFSLRTHDWETPSPVPIVAGFLVLAALLAETTGFSLLYSGTVADNIRWLNTEVYLEFSPGKWSVF